MVEKENKQGLRKIYRKSWPYDNLFGSSRFEFTSSVRGIWNDLIDMAKLSRVRQGLISPGEGQSYPHTWLAGFLNVPLEELEDAISVLKETKRIIENGSGIEIVNFAKYQSEYEKQLPYRQSKKARLEQQKEWRNAGLCENCGEEGHDKFNCPHSKYQNFANR